MKNGFISRNPVTRTVIRKISDLGKIRCRNCNSRKIPILKSSGPDTETSIFTYNWECPDCGDNTITIS